MEVKLSFRQFSHGEFSGCHAHRKYSLCQRKSAAPSEPRLLKSIAKVDLPGRARRLRPALGRRRRHSVSLLAGCCQSFAELG